MKSKLSFSGPPGSDGICDILEVAKMTHLAGHRYMGKPFPNPLMPSDAYVAAGVGYSALLISSVLHQSGVAQITKPIVVSHAIDVVNVMRGPSVMRNRIGYPVSRLRFAEQFADKIALSISLLKRFFARKSLIVGIGNLLRSSPTVGIAVFGQACPPVQFTGSRFIPQQLPQEFRRW